MAENCEILDEASEGGEVILTERMAMIHQLVVVEGKRQTDAAKILGITRQGVYQALQEVKRRFVVAGHDPDGLGVEVTVANSRSEMSPEAKAFLEGARMLGLHPPHIQAILARYRGEVPGAEEEPAPVDERKMALLVDARIQTCLQYLDHSVLAQSTSSQLAKALGTLFQMRQLLRGEATSIVRTEDRRTLQEIGQALTEEIKRRKLGRRKLVDVTPERIS